MTLQGLHHPWILSADNLLDSDIDVDSVNFYRACQRFQHITRVVGTLYQLQNLVRHADNPSASTLQDDEDAIAALASIRSNSVPDSRLTAGYVRLDDDNDKEREKSTSRPRTNTAGDAPLRAGDDAGTGLRQRQRSLTDLVKFAVPTSRRAAAGKSLSDEGKAAV